MTNLKLLDEAVRLVRERGPWEVAFMPGGSAQSTAVGDGFHSWWSVDGLMVSHATMRAIHRVFADMSIICPPH